MKAVNNYLKNVMKSVAYAAADVSSDYMPNIKEFSDANKEFGTATYAALRNPKQTLKRSVQAIQDSKVYKALDYGARNLTEDLRTGNFYNKARKERDELALSGLDVNWDDLSEFGVDNNWDKNLESSSSTNQEISAGDKKIVESIEGSNAALASATVNAVVTSSQNEIKNNRANTAMLYMQNEKLLGGLHKDLTILGSTMQQMYKLQSASLQNIDKNMSGFFTQESKLSAERNAILKEMLELQRNVYKSAADREKEAAGKKKNNRVRWSDINVNGVADINAYFNAVKKNINNELASIMPAGFGEDSNMLATFMVSPLEGAMKYVVNGIIPATVKAAAKEFDGSISGIFGNIIGELGNARSKNEGGLLGTIAKFLGISTSVNRNIDTSRYEKGPVPFDGITRKAIIDVIPTHLRRIEAAITGRPEEMFDYKAGRWVKVANVKKQFDDIKKNAVRRATSDLREAMNPGVQAVRKGIDNKSDQDAWDKAIEEFEQFLYENNGRFNPKESASKNGISSAYYPNLYRHYNKIKTIYKDFDKIESTDRNGRRITRNTKNSIRIGLSRNVLDAKDAEEKQYRDIETDIGNVLNSYFGIPKADAHGKWKDNGKFEAYNILKNTTDNLGNTIFDYLQNINKELTWFRMNGIPGGGGSSYRGKAPVSFDSINIKNPSMVRNNDSEKRQLENKRISESALRAIASGKAIDLRDFDEDEQAYLLRLSSMLSDNAVNEYKSEIKGYNENAISGFMDKHFIKTNIKSLKDVDEAIKKAEKEGKNTNEVNMDNKEEKFFKKIMNRIGAGESILGGIVGASSEAFTNLLYTADKAIYEMMYKTEISDETKQKYKGFMDMMAGKMTDTFKKVSDWFKKDILDPFKERLGIGDDFKDRFKNSLKNTGSRMWTAFRDANASVYGPIFDKIKSADIPIVEDIKNAKEKQKAEDFLRDKFKYKLNPQEQKKSRRDAMSTKEARDKRNKGLYKGINDILNLGKNYNFYSDNEHELEDKLLDEGLVTKEKLDKIRNSFYDKDKNFNFDGYRAALTKIYMRNIHNANAKGTPSGKPFSGLTTLTKGEGLISGSGFGVVPKTGVYNVTSPTHIINTEDMHSITGGPRVSVQQALGKEKLAAKRSGFNVASNADGTESLEKQFDTKTVLSEAKKYIPEAASGGLIGGILSLVLGLAGGPLLGAAVGAGGSILASSDGLKAKLFGKAGEDGKNDGTGIISKTVMDKFHKYFPDMAKYGLAGLIPGLLTPLGPVGGLLIGGAFGFLKNNEKFTNKYFGEDGEFHIRSKEKKIIENMLPGALKGAGVGAIASVLFGGPFGLLGNAALGAGLGMMGSTEDFKNLILGEEINGERMGGIVGAFKDAFEPFTESMKKAGSRLTEAFDNHLIKPLGRFIAPAIHALPIALGSIPRKISEIIDKKTQGIRRTIGGRVKDMLRPVGKVASKVLSPVAGVVGGALALPGQIIGRTGDKLRAYDIRHGDMVDMTQREAVEWMDETGRGKQVSAMLRASSKVGSGEEGSMDVNEARSVLDSLNRMNDTEASAKKNLSKKNAELNKLLDNYKDPETGKKLSTAQIKGIIKAAESGNFEKISKLLQSKSLDGSKEGMTKAQFNSFMEEGGLKAAVMEAANAKTRLHNINNITGEEAESTLKAALEKLGISEKDFDIKDKKQRAKFAALLSDQLTTLEANPDDVQEKLETDNHDNIKDTAEAVKDILKLMLAKYSEDDEAVEAAREDVTSRLDLGKDKVNEKYDKNIEAARKVMDDDESDALTEKGMDVLSTGKHIKDAGKFGAAGANNTTDGFKNARKVFNRIGVSEDLIRRLTPEAHKELSSMYDFKAKNIGKALSRKNIRTVIIDGKYQIDPKTIKLLSNKIFVKDLDKNCDLLIKIHNSPNGKDIYSRFKDLQEIANLTLKEKANLRYEFLSDNNSTNAVGDFASDVQAKVEDAASESDENTIESNSIGTILLGAGKALGKGILNVGKSAVKGVGSLAKRGMSAIGSLFGGGEGTAGAGFLSGLFGGGGHGLFGGHQSAGNTDETDKAGDGKDLIHVGGGDMIHVERDSSGNVEPDTSDSKTKTILNKLSLKEKMTEKVQQAQLKMSEIIKNNFDTSDIKESKGGKIGWLGLLLAGGLLWKSGMLKKVFDGVIKPIWTDHVKPWIDTKVVPWISDKWENKIKPWLTDTAIPALGKLFTEGIGVLIKSLPSIIGSVLDTSTGNKYNAGGSTTVDSSNLSETRGSDYETGMYDENGNKLTTGDITNGNFKKIYNAQGIEGTVNSNGDVTFKDDSMKGASYVNSAVNAAGHGFVKSLYTGKRGIFTRGATKVSNFLSKRHGLLAKGAGLTGKALTKPVSGAEGLGVRLHDTIDKVAKETAEQVNQGAVKGTEETVKKATKDVAKATGKAVGEGAEEVGEQLAKKTAESVKGAINEGVEKVTNTAAKGAAAIAKEGGEAVAKGAGKAATDLAKGAGKAAANKGLLAKMAGRIKDAIGKLFGDKKVGKKLLKLAENLGIKDATKWLKGLKSQIDEIFQGALDKAVKKLGAQTLKTAAKVFWWVMLIIDFLTGCDQAESILGVSETSIVEEIIAGFINAICNLTGILAIFPGVPWIAKFLFKLFGKDLEERQKQADEEYQKYKEETGSTLTKEEYLKRQKSLTGKVGGWISDGFKKVGKGIKGIFTKKDKSSETTTVAANAKGTTSISDATEIASPVAAVTNATNDKNGILGNITSGDFKFSDLNKIMEKVKEGKVSIFSKEFWKTSSNNDNTLKGALEKSHSMLTKITNLPMLMVKDALESMVTDIEDIGNNITGSNTTSTSTANTAKKSTIGSKIKEILTTAVEKIKEFFGVKSGKGTGNYSYGTGLYSKQIDPSVAGIRFNTSGDSEYQTIGDSACGPAAAVNAIESMYGRGSAVASAAKYAIKRGYKETNGGTKPGFFSDYFSRNGLSSQTSYNKSVIARNINNGLPTVIMGSNPKGVSSSSPFGKNPHYVTVTGTDGKGNAIVQDPESRYDNQLYPLSSLMRNTSLGVSAYGRSKWGRGDYDAQIWWYLTQKMGMTDHGAAGMMGNLASESGLHPDRVQGDIPYSNYSVDYTNKVDNGEISEYDFVNNGPNGGGYGLAQWTYYSRKQNLYDLAKKRKVSISDLTTQLDHLNNELGNNNYGGLLNILQTTDSLKEASNKVLVKYENPEDQSSDVKKSRRKKGKTFLNKYKGTIGEEITGVTLPGDATSTGSDDSTTGSSTGNESTSASDSVSSATNSLMDILTNSNAGKALSLFTDLFSSGSESSDDSSTNGSTWSIENNGYPASSATGYAAKMIEIAKGEIGTKETPENYVKYNDWYYGKENFGGADYHWCNAFISWVANQAGVPTDIIPKSARCKDTYEYLYDENNKISTSNAQPGDLAIFTNDGGYDGIYHIGLVTGNNKRKINTIEGNSGEEGVVGKYTYDADSKKLIILRPKYENIKAAEGGNGIKPLSRFGQFKDSIYGKGSTNGRIEHKTSDGYIMMERSAIESKPEIIENNNRKVYNKTNIVYGKGTTDYSKLINTIITILMTIADNTDKLNTIISILNNKLNLNISASDVSNVTNDNLSLKAKLANALNGITNTSKLNNYADSVSDNSINSIISAMNAIASE